MFGTTLIVFRETLEAALFIGIIAASTQGILHRTKWLSTGILIGAMGSFLLASMMKQLSDWAEGIGQELVTICILSVALIMLAWHAIWVNAHAKQMVLHAKSIGQVADHTSASLWAVAIAVAMAVVREGAETVLFVAGLSAGTQYTPSEMASSVLLGLILGIVTGWLIYSGLGKLKPHRLFQITNILLLLLAGNLASQLAKVLNQSDWLPWLSESAWDTSNYRPNDSLFGMVLHGVVGYDANPSQMQLLAYVSTAAVIWVASKLASLSADRPKAALFASA
jgi:high-affinity iron transporter